MPRPAASRITAVAALLAALVAAGCAGEITIGPPTPGTSASQR